MERDAGGHPVFCIQGNVSSSVRSLSAPIDLINPSLSSPSLLFTPITMARDRLAARKAAGAGGGGYQEPALNAPSVPAQSAYQQPQPPMASQNQYAQQSYTPVPGMGPGGPAYAQQPVQQDAYGQPPATQYGQQDRYDAGGVQNGGGALTGDFWSEVSTIHTCWNCH